MVWNRTPELDYKSPRPDRCESLAPAPPTACIAEHIELTPPESPAYSPSSFVKKTNNKVGELDNTPDLHTPPDFNTEWLTFERVDTLFEEDFGFDGDDLENIFNKAQEKPIEEDVQFPIQHDPYVRYLSPYQLGNLKIQPELIEKVKILKSEYEYLNQARAGEITLNYDRLKMILYKIETLKAFLSQMK